MTFLLKTIFHWEMALTTICFVVILAAAMNGALLVAIVSTFPVLWVIYRPLKWKV